MDSSLDRPVFILGVERSGTTWLANILDAHPESRLYMEPFAPQVRAFADFPDRLVYLSTLNSFLERHLRNEMGTLSDYKYTLFQRPGESRLKRKLIFKVLYPISEFTARGIQALGWDWPRRIRRFKNLNKNRLQNSELNQFPEDAEHAVTIIKEVRLNFKVGIIKEMWPTARVFVMVRNPLSQIASILRLIRQDSLHQLRGALYAFLEHSAQCSRFQKYQDALKHLNNESLVHRATAYWFLNYGTLIEDLNQSGVAFQVVRHETLSRTPNTEREKILDFVGLTERGTTEKYVTASSQATNRIRSDMDTQRNSKAYYLEALQAVGGDLKDSFFDAAGGFWELTPAPLYDYRSWLREHVER